MHSWCRVGRVFDPLRLARMKLRVYDGARKRNSMPLCSVDTARDQPPFVIDSVRCREPLSVRAEARLAEFRSRHFDYLRFVGGGPAKPVKRAASSEHDRVSRGMEHGRERVNRRPACQLDNIAVGKRREEQLRCAGSIRGKEQLSSPGRNERCRKYEGWLMDGCDVTWRTRVPVAGS